MTFGADCAATPSSHGSARIQEAHRRKVHKSPEKKLHPGGCSRLADHARLAARRQGACPLRLEPWPAEKLRSYSCTIAPQRRTGWSTFLDELTPPPGQANRCAGVRACRLTRFPRNERMALDTPGAYVYSFEQTQIHTQESLPTWVTARKEGRSSVSVSDWLPSDPAHWRSPASAAVTPLRAHRFEMGRRS